MGFVVWLAFSLDLGMRWLITGGAGCGFAGMLVLRLEGLVVGRGLGCWLVVGVPLMRGWLWYLLLVYDCGFTV